MSHLKSFLYGPPLSFDDWEFKGDSGIQRYLCLVSSLETSLDNNRFSVFPALQYYRLCSVPPVASLIHLIEDGVVGKREYHSSKTRHFYAFRSFSGTRVASRVDSVFNHGILVVRAPCAGNMSRVITQSAIIGVD
jgi:hypothetical protein